MESDPIGLAGAAAKQFKKADSPCDNSVVSKNSGVELSDARTLVSDTFWTLVELGHTLCADCCNERRLSGNKINNSIFPSRLRICASKRRD
jgi:hypothetical protein